MTGDQKRQSLLLPIFCVLLMLVGCAQPAYRAHPEFEMRIRHLNAPGLMPLDIKIYEVSGVGFVELREDWSATIRENLAKALIRCLRGRGYELKVLIIDDATEGEIEEIQALYRAVNKSIQLHTYGPQLFPEKEKNFEYSLGSVDGILRKFGRDSLIFVHGFEHVSKGRGDAHVSVAMVDSSGGIVWYCMRRSQGKQGLRDPEMASALVENMLAHFPR